MKNILNGDNTYPAENQCKTSEFISDSGIKVTCVYPQSIPEHIRRQKINRMYDILSVDRNKIDTE